MFVEVQDKTERTVWVNTATITFIRDYGDYDYAVCFFADGNELRLARSEMKKVKAALLRHNNLEGHLR